MTQNKNLLPTIGALGLGAGLMYLMDPEMGRRRRALVRDKFMHLEHETGDFVTGQAQNLKNHAKGWMHEAKGMFRHNKADASMDTTVDYSMDDAMSGSMSEPYSETTKSDFTTND